MPNGEDIDQGLNFSVPLNTPDPEALAEGFNQYGVKDGEDRVEFIYEAMTPGMRNGVFVTNDFLQTVAEKDYSEIPLQLDHSRSQLSNVGYVTDVWFSDNALRLRGYTPKTGAETHEEVVKRFTFNPPQIRDGSIGFGRQYEMTEIDDGKPMLVDGTIQEFSLVPFPGGYGDSGGLKAQFMEAYHEYTTSAVDDGSDEPEKAESHALITTTTF